MLDLDDAFGSNETASTEGVWVPLGENSKVLVTRLGNPKAQAAYRRIPATVRRQLDAGTLGEEATEEFLCKYMADNILLDWKGIAFPKGKEYKYSVQNAIKILASKRRFRDKIWELAGDEDLFNVRVEEEDIKNSSKG